MGIFQVVCQLVELGNQQFYLHLTFVLFDHVFDKSVNSHLSCLKPLYPLIEFPHVIWLHGSLTRHHFREILQNNNKNFTSAPPPTFLNAPIHLRPSSTCNDFALAFSHHHTTSHSIKLSLQSLTSETPYCITNHLAFPTPSPQSTFLSFGPHVAQVTTSSHLLVVTTWSGTSAL